MKKRDEGYVLVYVMIVIVLVSALGLSVCSVALRNLQVQENAVQRMQHVYTAEGQIEQFCTWLQTLKKPVETNANAAFVDAVKAYYDRDHPDLNVECNLKTPESDEFTVTVRAKAEGVQVVAELTVYTHTYQATTPSPDPSASPDPAPSPDPTPTGNPESYIKTVRIEYESYKITNN